MFDIEREITKLCNPARNTSHLCVHETSLKQAQYDTNMCMENMPSVPNMSLLHQTQRL
jgi:hypothetical protein